MTTTYEELYKRALLRLDRNDARALLAVKEAVNSAHKDIARVWDVDELIVRDTESAVTLEDTRTYHIEDDLNLDSPKDIMSIVLEDESNSRKLLYKTPKWVDENMPYPENMSTGKPEIYTRRGNYLDLLPIADDNYPLYITYSQWPTVLEDDDDETDYVDLDDVIIALTVERADAILRGVTGVDWTERARMYLAGAIREDRSRPDELLFAKPFRSTSRVTSEYWKDPFVKENP